MSVHREMVTTVTDGIFKQTCHIFHGTLRKFADSKKSWNFSKEHSETVRYSLFLARNLVTKLLKRILKAYFSKIKLSDNWRVAGIFWNPIKMFRSNQFSQQLKVSNQRPTTTRSDWPARIISQCMGEKQFTFPRSLKQSQSTEHTGLAMIHHHLPCGLPCLLLP